MAIQLPILLKV